MMNSYTVNLFFLVGSCAYVAGFCGALGWFTVRTTIRFLTKRYYIWQMRRQEVRRISRFADDTV